MQKQFKFALFLSCLISLTVDADTKYPPSAYKEGAIKCMRSRDFGCAEINWTQYIKMRPTDARSIAALAVTLNWADKPEPAIIQAEKAINMGEGTYDLFAAYTESLEKVGRVDDAIDWGYKTLAVLPSLVNIRGSLAKLLVQRKREYEALALLASFDATLEARGRPGYFSGQRISIETTLETQQKRVVTSQKRLRLSKVNEHFYAPVKLGESKFQAFMIDTGATKTTLSEDVLVNSKVNYKVTQPSVMFQLADGRKINGRIVTLENLKIGPYDQSRVSAFVCKTCQSLLGQGSLSKFNLSSTKTQGVEFLTLELR
jgi:predicted aspartyl protease